MTLRAILLLVNQVRDLKNLNLLYFRAINHAHNSQDAFANFYPMRKKVYTATEKQIISYG